MKQIEKKTTQASTTPTPNQPNGTVTWQEIIPPEQTGTAEAGTYSDTTNGIEISWGNQGISWRYPGVNGEIIQINQDALGNYVWTRQDTQGGVIEQYQHDVSANGNFIDRHTQIGASGITTTTRVGGLIDTQTDSNGDGQIDGRTLNTATGQGWNLFDFNSRLDAEQHVVELRGQGQVSVSWYESLTNWITKQLVTGGGTNTFLNDFGLSQAPIGAFYESKTPAADTAAAIAHKTSVLLDANGRGLSAQTLGALDGNKDGQLSGTEINTLKTWIDANENGLADSGEIQTLAQAGLTAIRATDYGFYTRGNSRYAPAPTTDAPARVDQTEAVPASNYRTLRDTDNRYYVVTGSGYGWIDWTASKIKINYNNKAHLIGTDGNDNFNATYYAQYTQYFNSALLTHFLAGGGNDFVGGSVRHDRIWGGTGDDTLFGYLGDDKLYGEEGNDELQGNEGNDALDGGVGNDRLFGQVGNDVLSGGDGNDILMGFTAGNEAKQSLNPGETDNDFLYGGRGADNLYGGAGDDYLDGGDDNDLLKGDAGGDTLFGGNGDDELQGSDGHDRLLGEAGNDKLFGQTGDDTLWGGDGDDILMGFTAANETKQSLAADETDNDSLYGGTGRDLLQGGLGDDLLHGEAGVDELQGGAGRDMAYGGDDNDRLFGQVGDDVLYGGAGDDLIYGFTGANEAKQSLNVGETDNDWLYGGAGNDTLVGGLGDDYLDGGAGADIMEGGAGNDTYIVNSVNDSILERAGEGYDTVVSSANTLLNTGIEELRLAEGLDIHGTGNALDNRILGNSRNNILDGVTGADILIGGAGDDIYYVDNLGDQTVELAGEGVDTVQSSLSHTLGVNLENLVLLDFSKPEKGLADGKPILVYGYPKANELDYMQGDAFPNYQGTCALTSIANLLTQADRPTTESQVVQLAIDRNWAVTDPGKTAYERGGSNHVQQQQILNSYGIRNDLLAGYNEQAAANLIRSGRGVILALNAGKLWGDPAYLGDGGVNHVVTLTGVAYGEADGALTGFYIADSGRKKVSDMTRFVGIEEFRQTARVPNAYALYTKEALKLWNEDIDGQGNELANVLVGNRGDNRLAGGAGNDTLEGGAGGDLLVGGTGSDTLNGGLGNDTYLFNRGDGPDTWSDLDSTAGNQDIARFGAGISYEQLWLKRSGNHLEASVIGTADKITVQNWYSGSANHIERFEAGGKALLDSKVDLLVQAMAAFAPPAAGQSTLPDNYRQALAPVLAANWQ
ncbi:MAG: calcium-binding protein [Pseudomonadota bacterium]|nr:calcium-binding protein [Pseudomonadota bacterium]